MVTRRNQRKDAGIRLEPFECRAADQVKVIASTVLGSQRLRVTSRVIFSLHHIEEITHDYHGSVLFECVVHMLFQEGSVAVR